MIAVGIDVGKEKHTIGAVSSNEQIVRKAESFSQNRAGSDKVLRILKEVRSEQPIRIGMEATGRYWIVLRYLLVKEGYKVEVINPIITSGEIRRDVRGTKSDEKDAISIARVMLSNRHNPVADENPHLDALKAITRHRTFVVRQRSAVKNTIRSLLDCLFPEIDSVFDDIFASTPMAVLTKYPSARLLADANINALTAILKKASRGKCGIEKARMIKNAAKQSIAVDMQNCAEEYALLNYIAEIRFYDEQIHEIEKKLEEMPIPQIVHQLSAIKGVGKKHACLIIGEYGDLERFVNPPSTGGKPKKPSDMHKRLLAFAGCEPRIRTSGKWKGKVKVSKRGSPNLRTALYQAAFTCVSHTSYFAEVYKKQINKGKAHSCALFFVIKKLIIVICAMYRNKTIFNPPNAEEKKC